MECYDNIAFVDDFYENSTVEKIPLKSQNDQKYSLLGNGLNLQKNCDANRILNICLDSFYENSNNYDSTAKKILEKIEFLEPFTLKTSGAGAIFCLVCDKGIDFYKTFTIGTSLKILIENRTIIEIYKQSVENFETKFDLPHQFFQIQNLNLICGQNSKTIAKQLDSNFGPKWSVLLANQLKFNFAIKTNKPESLQKFSCVEIENRTSIIWQIARNFD